MPLPVNLDFDVMTSRGGESMTSFLNRLRREDLSGLAWLFNDSVVKILGVKPSNGMLHECVVRFQEGVVVLKIHRHGGWRKKLFDSDLMMGL